MVYVRALAVWLAIIFCETLHGTARTLWLAPWLGDFRARQVSVFTGALIIFTVTCLFIRRIGARGVPQLLGIGIMWVALTVAFEVVLGRFVLGFPWERITSDYRITEGGLLGLGLAFMAFCPLLAAKLLKSSG